MGYEDNNYNSDGEPADRRIDKDLVFKHAMTHDFEGLKDLSINMEFISELDAGNGTIRQMKNLLSLNLSDNRISKIQHIETLRTLQSLNLS